MTLKIDLDLQNIAVEAAFLPELERGWASESETNRYVWYSEWLDLMTRLKHLDAAHTSGVMTAEQQDRFRALLARLKAAAPIIARVDLPLPPIPMPA